MQMGIYRRASLATSNIDDDIRQGYTGTAKNNGIGLAYFRAESKSNQPKIEHNGRRLRLWAMQDGCQILLRDDLNSPPVMVNTNPKRR
jgi:hypothetical protein